MTIIIDYGIGNVFSVQRSLEHCGDQNVKLSSDPDQIYNADKIILPGVGAFRDGIQGLTDKNLIEPILDGIKRGKPILGICLGMQMLASSSTEFGNYDGLDVIPGKVIPIIDNKEYNDNLIKIPHIGWSSLNIKNELPPKSILNKLDNKSYAYLVHSFHVKTSNESHTTATYNYANLEVTAAIQKDNVIGLQFHPEKSGQFGLNIIKKFISL